MLDEVAPSTNENELRDALAGLESDDKGDWNIDFGQSGGRQRGVIASRMLLERLPEFSDIVPYPEAERRRLYDRMVAADELRPQLQYGRRDTRERRRRACWRASPAGGDH